jgi:hypothetical protein
VGCILLLNTGDGSRVTGIGGGDNIKCSVGTLDHTKFNENLPFDTEKFHSGSRCAIPFAIIMSDRYLGKWRDADMINIVYMITQKYGF